MSSDNPEISDDQVSTIIARFEEFLEAHPERATQHRLFAMEDIVDIVLMSVFDNHTQQEIAEHFEVSQPTISRVLDWAVTAMDEALDGWDPEEDDAAYEEGK